METEHALKEFGLTDMEIKVYLGLLKLGETTVPEIVKNTGVYKASVYDTLDRLEKKTLVTHIKKENKLFYSPLSPKRLFEILENKKNVLDSVFPLLNGFYNSKKTKREVNILSGRSGIKTFFNDVYGVNKDVYSIGSSLQIFSVMEHRLIQFLKTIKNRKFSIRLIVVDRVDTRKQAVEFQKTYPILNFKFYYEKHFSPVAFATYGDRLALTIWDVEPLIIMIKDKHVAKTFKNYFEMIWAVSKK